MLRKLPAIDIPAATEANILHAAAFLEFKHVLRLEREGSELAAYTCWMHGVEVRHSPYVLASNTESELFPPLVKMPCCAGDCQLILEGSNSSSPGGGCGAAAESSCHEMWRRAMLGTITTSIRTGWISPSLRPTPTTPRPLTWYLRTFTGFSSDVRVTLDNYAYTDYAPVVGLAGHHVADDCLQTRARVEEELLAARAQAVEGNPKGPAVLRPSAKDHLQEEAQSHQCGQELQRGRPEAHQWPRLHAPGHGLLQATWHFDGRAQA